jgi:hypothetical protein
VIRLLAPLLLLALAGCVAPSPEVAWVGGPPPDAEYVLDRLASAERAYVKRFGPLPRPIAVLVLWPSHRLPTNGQHGGWTSWDPSWGGDIIHVAYGDRRYPLIYRHELHHARIRDPLHTDPSWRGVGP